MNLLIFALVGALIFVAARPLRLALCKCFPKLRFGRRLASTQVPPGWIRVELQKPDNSRLVGWLREVDGWAVAVASHGGGTVTAMASKADMVPYGETLAGLGISTLALDAFGFGESDGLASPQGFADGMDVLTGIQWVQNRFPKHDIGLVGFSRGAVVSIRALGQMDNPPSFAVLEGIGIERWEDVLIPGRSHSLLDIVARWTVFAFAGLFVLVGFRRPVGELASILSHVRCPLLFIAASLEPEELSRVREFYELYRGPKFLYRAPAGAHGAIAVQHAEELAQVLSHFLIDREQRQRTE